jgi:hypothetical protein
LPQSSCPGRRDRFKFAARGQFGLEVSNGGIIDIGSSSVTRNYMARVVDVSGTHMSRTGNTFIEDNRPGARTSTIPTE